MFFMYFFAILRGKPKPKPKKFCGRNAGRKEPQIENGLESKEKQRQQWAEAQQEVSSRAAGIVCCNSGGRSGPID